MIKAAVMGYGTIGSGVVEILQKSNMFWIFEISPGIRLKNYWSATTRS